MFEKVAAQQVAVFVALEVRGTVHDGLAVEGHGKQGQVLGQRLHIVFLTGAEAAGLDDGANLFRQSAHVVHFLLQAATQAHFFTQAGNVAQQRSHHGQILDALHMLFHRGFDLGDALGRFGIGGRK